MNQKLSALYYNFCYNGRTVHCLSRYRFEHIILIIIENNNCCIFDLHEKKITLLHDNVYFHVTKFQKPRWI